MKHFTVFVVLLVTTSSPRSQKEHDRAARAMEERHRRPPGPEDGAPAEHRFMASRTRYAQDNEDRFRQLHQSIQPRNHAESATASPQHPTAASPSPSSVSVLSQDERKVLLAIIPNEKWLSSRRLGNESGRPQPAVLTVYINPTFFNA